MHNLQFHTAVFLIILLQGCASGQQNPAGESNPIKPGQTSKLNCEADTIQKYSIYLPSSYSTEKSWPLLICFDPHAEGLLPVNLFREQADKQGFILAGSNNSMNGMALDETTLIYRKLLADLQGRFNIDTSSVYVAGFSGGSRVAGAAAITEGNIAGVVGCGAGLPNMNRQPLRPFSYLAVSGNQDFNYNELKQVDESLGKAGYVHHMLVFDGIHQWPVKEVIPDIFTWLVFDRMRRHSLPTNRELINAFIDRNYSRSQSAGDKGDLLEQQSLLIMMRDYLSGLTDITPLQSEIEKLDNDPRVKQQKLALQEIADRERVMQSEYSGKMQSQGPGYWSQEATKLRAIADKQPVSNESRMYKRLLGFLSLNAYMYCNSALKQDDLTSASRFIEIYRMIDPTNAEHRYMAATISMKQGNSEKAIKELQDAISLDFKEFKRLRNEAVFAPLHSDQRFRNLLKGH